MQNLTAQLLIAMPGMGDPRFANSLVFLCKHSAHEGAMGVIVNKPLPDVRFSDMLDQLSITSPGSDGGAGPDVPVCYGGPVDRQRGFVLHSAEYRGRQDDALEIDGRFVMTATMDVLEDLAAGLGPERSLLALGYAGWAAGQLEDEIQANGWLTCEADEALVFGTPMETKWAAALGRLGVNPLALSSEAGRA